MKILIALRHVCAFVLVALLASGCGTLQDKAQWEQRVGATGRIREIDYEARRMVVQVGLHRLTLRVSEAVPGFADRRVGDRMHIDYLQAVVVAVEVDETQEVVDITRYEMTAPQDGQPGIALVRKRQFAAEFVDFDYQSGLTTFRLDDGSYPQVLIPQQLRPYIRTRALGDRMLISVEQAIAVSDVPAN